MNFCAGPRVAMASTCNTSNIAGIALSHSIVLPVVFNLLMFFISSENGHKTPKFIVALERKIAIA